MKARLATIGARIDRMIAAPDDVGGRLTRFFAPVYRILGWQAKFGSKRLAALLAAFRRGDASASAISGAVRELERNVTIAERCVAVSRRVPTAYASWMQRVLDVLRRIEAAGARPDATLGFGGLDATRLLPPLRVDLGATKRNAALPNDARRAHAEELSKHPEKVRLLELELAAIDQITEAARSETRFLERRRRLLEGARRLLLDAAAALPLDPEGVRARERALADQITQIHRLVALGIDARVSLSFQARAAARRGDRERAYAALSALETFGALVGDGSLANASAKGTGELRGAPSPDRTARDRESQAQSAREVFGDRVVDEVRALYEHARAGSEAPKEADDPELRALSLQYLAPGAEDAALAALLTADGCFEVGAALSPVKSREVEEFARLVAHPTPEMVLTNARSLEDLPGAIIEDPRRILLDLASGRLLSRRFVERGQRVRERTHLTGEVRVFLLDASTSMLEDGIEMSRARMRDAILVGELATMIRRLEEPGRRVRLTLYYRFFTKRMGELRAVRTSREAVAAMGDFIGKARIGGTAIQEALLSSFALLREQKREDPDLARASIVLVTDGAAPVDPALLREAREATGVPIAVSVIALGEENPVLRDLVARQRAKGERAFYHFVDDERLAELCRGETLGRAVHLGRAETPSVDVEAALEGALSEIDDLSRTRASGLSAKPPASPGDEGSRALVEAENRDRSALERRYLRWFPKPAATSKPAADPALPADAPDVSSPDDDAVLVLLATIAEVVGELGGDPFHRQADAIEIVERLLVDARLSPERYLAVVASHSPRIDAALGAVHVAIRRV
ncbi:MAG: vWA domain-containing protein [Polyangiaceae bacterium]